jgi:Fungal protein kinase
MLHAIANLTLPHLGYADVVKPAPLLNNPRQTADIFDGLELKLSDGTRLLLGSTIFHWHGIIGRWTCVVRARHVEKGKYSGTDDAWDGLILKLSWPAKSRIPENSIIEKARNAADHDEHRWVLKHLPKVLHAEYRHVNLLSRALIDRMGDQYEERVLRIMVQEELFPITEQKPQSTSLSPSVKYSSVCICLRYLCATAHSFDSRLQMAI